jgi:hypothetical protein
MLQNGGDGPREDCWPPYLYLRDTVVATALPHCSEESDLARSEALSTACPGERPEEACKNTCRNPDPFSDTDQPTPVMDKRHKWRTAANPNGVRHRISFIPTRALQTHCCQ